MTETTEVKQDNDDGIRPMISMSQVLKRIPLSRSTIERKVKEGTFPHSYPIAPMRVGFFLDEIVEWQKQLVAKAAAKAA
ncbi:helix-turn-helix transcriptional regulator [Bradyrhizobium elkanii]|uniref:DNA-binding transcriptional regulator AlpA n=1 Tax=Bradyrhizobium elkanii TaxID=29448 RepID=A0ABV4EZT8_BRAEL|nr:AlpA family phage regulatory protein [Bradyrhizobium elkanii]MCP1757711.1 prophage regulatory protein [Bradyrhizobium elkanii]MCS3881992.1 prophage regulatory protein [Bradyrhizobium elkanii]MCS4218752.1 prophage regulatory protein [Bradyrhizobium elkanii]MCW2109941.1 prophage regulatory protein [Bradyrhizobium elkanii]MCW2201686.1 prophage regulatory protein [Bradyrhizobium elkanii]